jgi:molecular chaperone GrpE
MSDQDRVTRDGATVTDATATDASAGDTGTGDAPAPVDPVTGGDPAVAEAAADAAAAAAGAEGEAAVDSDAAAVEVEADVAELARVAGERDDYLDALRRLQADFENYKKRMLRQQTEHLERAAETLVEKLLPVLDTADLAVSHGAGEAVAQLATALTDVLAREGLERIDPLDEPFDPNVADAVAHEPGDGGAMTVAEVMRAGYRWKGRVLRPAMVKVRG